MSLIDLPLEDLRTEVPFACRFRTQSRHLQRIARVPVAELPPIVVFQETDPAGGSTLWLADGGYRFEAAQQQNLPVLPADVRPGNCADAILYACQVNDRHGVPRSAADRRAAILKLLGNPLFSGQSDRWIAEQCHVNHTTVGRIRKKLGALRGPREGRDGKLRRLPETGEARAAEPEVERSSRDRALEELARAKAEIDEAIRAAKHSGIERSDPSTKILKKLRAARQEVLAWEESLRNSPPEPPVPDPNDTSPAGMMAAEMYRIRRMPPAEFLSFAQKVMSHDREMIRRDAQGECGAPREGSSTGAKSARGGATQDAASTGAKGAQGSATPAESPTGAKSAQQTGEYSLQTGVDPGGIASISRG